MSELELLRTFLRYNPETGDLRWAMNRPRLPGESEGIYHRWLSLYAGHVPGSIQQNGKQLRRVFQLRGKQYSAHRVACAIHHGTLPREGDVTAENGDYLDLRSVNLRLRDTRNQSARRPTASGGCRGVYWHEGSKRWHVRDNKDRHVGCFNDYDQAVACRRTATGEGNMSPLTHLQSFLEIQKSRFGSVQELVELAEQEELRQQACGMSHLAEIARREKLKQERREAAMDTRLPHAP